MRDSDSSWSSLMTSTLRCGRSSKTKRVEVSILRGEW